MNFYKTTTGLAGILYSLSSSPAYAQNVPATAAAQSTNPCEDPSNNWYPPRLERALREADGYRGSKKYARDGKLGLDEYADYIRGSMCQYLKEGVELCAGRVKPKNKEDIWHVRMQEVAMGYTLEELRPYDANRDGYLTPADDVDGDGVITCEDAKKYVPPPKKINPTKARTGRRK